MVLILLYLYFSGQPDAFGLVGGRCFASPDEEFTWVAVFYCLEVAIELVELIEVSEVVADADGGIDAFDLACPEGATEV